MPHPLPPHPLDQPPEATAAPAPDPGPVPVPGWAEVPPPLPGPSRPDALPEGEAPASEAEPASPAPRSSPASTSAARRTIGRVSQHGLADAAAGVARGIGAALNGVTRQADDDQVWLMTEEEADGIGEAAGRIAARHLPDVPGGGSDPSDIADVIAMLVPGGMWLARSLAAWLPRPVKRRPRQARTVPGQVVPPGAAEARQ